MEGYKFHEWTKEGSRGNSFHESTLHGNAHVVRPLILHRGIIAFGISASEKIVSEIILLAITLTILTC